MNKAQKNEIIIALREKFLSYNNFYITDTESLSVENISTIRKECFSTNVEMKVAKNTLIKKALEGIDEVKYNEIFKSLHKVTALMFSENPKSPAQIIKNFKNKFNLDKPILKAAFINGDIFIGNDKLDSLSKIKTKNELIGDVIGILQSPAKRIIGGLLHKIEQSNEQIN